MVGEPDRIRVITVDDHEIFRGGIRFLMLALDDVELVAEAQGGDEALRLCEELQPDVVLMDVTMPVMGGLDATRKIKKEAPEIHVIGLSMHGSEDMRSSMLEAGAEEYLIKDSPASDLIAAINKVAANR